MAVEMIKVRFAIIMHRASISSVIRKRIEHQTIGYRDFSSQAIKGGRVDQVLPIANPSPLSGPRGFKTFWK
jgi:hypothetical protein